MSLSCSCGDGDGDYSWYYTYGTDFKVLDTKRSRKCCSCKSKINIGDEVVKLVRWREPYSDIEERICGDEVPLASWYLCEPCGGLLWAVDELGMCCDISENIADQIKEYRSECG